MKIRELERVINNNCLIIVYDKDWNLISRKKLVETLMFDWEILELYPNNNNELTIRLNVTQYALCKFYKDRLEFFNYD